MLLQDITTPIVDVVACSAIGMLTDSLQQLPCRSIQAMPEEGINATTPDQRAASRRQVKDKRNTVVL
jgi:hypothetical protein